MPRHLTYSARPIAVDFGSAFGVDVGIGPESTYAKTAEQWVFAWGLNTRKQLGRTSQEEIVSDPSEVMIRK